MPGVFFCRRSRNNGIVISPREQGLPKKWPQLAKLTRPRLYKAVARGLVSDAVARLRGAGLVTAPRI